MSTENDRLKADDRPNKDWLQIWYKDCGENVRWAKSQSWNAVQWTFALLGAVLVGAKNYKVASPLVWAIFASFVCLGTLLWLMALHNAASKERDTGEKIAKYLSERATYLPGKSGDYEWILFAKIVLLVGATGVAIYEILNN